MTGKHHSMLIAIFGGSGSGKSMFAQELHKLLGENESVVLTADSYYRDQSRLSQGELESVNFDHPDAIDFDLLIDHIGYLRDGRPIEMPVYDFATHSRSRRTITVQPARYIIVEGLLFLMKRRLRDEFDVRIFIAADDDIRLVRRIRRDVQERGRSVDSVINQYITSVKPMHYKHIEPTRRYADIVVDFNAFNQQELRNVVKKVKYHKQIYDAKRTGGSAGIISIMLYRPLHVIRNVYTNVLANFLGRYVLLFLTAVNFFLVTVRENPHVYFFDGGWPLFFRDYVTSPIFYLMFFVLFFTTAAVTKTGLENTRVANPLIRRYVFLEFGIYCFMIIAIYGFSAFYYLYY